MFCCTGKRKPIFSISKIVPAYNPSTLKAEAEL